VGVPAQKMRIAWEAGSALRTVQARAMALTPHHGGQAVRFSWPGGTCELDLARYTEHSPDHEARIRAYIDAIWAIGSNPGR
jgi:hypothetical protein